MATPDAFQILSTALDQAITPIVRVSDQNRKRGEFIADRANRDAREQQLYLRGRTDQLADRTYAETREEALHRRSRTEADADRIRALRNQLAALLPAGTTVDDKLTEAQLSQKIAELTRSVQIKYESEDSNRALDRKVKEAQTMSDAALRQKARELGVPDADTEDIAVLRQRVPELQVKLDQRIANLQTSEAIAQARSSPYYANLRNQLARVEAERSKVVGQATLPEPVYNPEITPEETAMIYRAIGQLPDIRAKLAALPNGEKIIASIDAGRMDEALAQVPAKMRDVIGMSLADKYKVLEERLYRTRGFRQSAAVKAYLTRLSELPRAIQRLDQAREELFNIGAKGGGTNFGLALRTEDPDALIQDIIQGNVPTIGNPGDEMGAELGPELPSGGMIPSIPPPSFEPQAEEAVNPSANRVEGVLPWIGRQVKEGAGGLKYLLTEDPVFNEGAARTSAFVDQGLSAAGQQYRNAKSLLLGGELNGGSPIPMDLDSGIKGPIGMVMGVPSMAGRFLNTFAPTQESFPPEPLPARTNILMSTPLRNP